MKRRSFDVRWVEDRKPLWQGSLFAMATLWRLAKSIHPRQKCRNDGTCPPRCLKATLPRTLPETKAPWCRNLSAAAPEVNIDFSRNRAKTTAAGKSFPPQHDSWSGLYWLRGDSGVFLLLFSEHFLLYKEVRLGLFGHLGDF